MKKKYLYLIILLAVGAASVIISILLERKAQINRIEPTLGYTDEMILAEGYFEIVAPEDENRGLDSDVVSYSLGDGYIHLVLPGKVSENSVVVYIRNASGVNLARREYDFRNKVTLGEWEIVVDRPNLPVMYFISDDPADFDAMCSKDTPGDIIYGDISIYVDDKTAKENGWYSEYLSSDRDKATPKSASLKGRGNSSWDCGSKKSFTLSLEKSLNILGMGLQSKWNLVGNAYDPSLLKNMVFNNLSSNAGIMNQPQMQYIDLYVDGRYQGVYLITTKINGKNLKLDKGDYLYKMDAPRSDQPLYYKSETWFEDGNAEPVADLVYPADADEDVKQKALIKLQDFIDCIENPDSRNIDDVADIDSLARYYWVQEATMNFDAWQRSVYLYYDASEDKMILGPAWDFDLTLGSPYEKASMQFADPYGFRIANAGWYTRLLENREFSEAVRRTYFEGGVKEALFAALDDFENQHEYLGADGALNYTIYGHSNLGTTLEYGDGYEDYCSNMIEFYRERISWIDEIMQAVYQ